MNASALPTAIELQTELHRSIVLVGKLEDLVEALPGASEQLANCSTLHPCGELPSEDPATELWHRINEIQPERIWIVGGDGTINLVGQCALRVDWKLPCWLTPAGTANDLARALAEHRSHLTVNTNQQPATVVLQPTIHADLLSIKTDNNPWSRCAANMFTLGTSARNTHHVTAEIKARWGALAYLTQAWRAMSDLQPFSVTMQVGRADERSIDNILNIFVANGPYCGGGFRVAPTAQIDDRRLDVLILRHGTTAELAHLATSFLTGNHLEDPLLEHFTTESLTIHCHESSPLTLDGEAFRAQTITIEVAPGRMPLNLVTAL